MENMYITYYLIIVAASSILKALERQKVTGRPATVLHYYTVLIKVTLGGHTTSDDFCAHTYSMATSAQSNSMAIITVIR